MTSCLNQVKHEFDNRHEFDDDNEDLVLFKTRWPNIKFYNIPIAWIVVLDTMLCKLRYNNPILEIRQEFGQPVILHGLLDRGQEKIILEAEQAIYAIDEDLRV